MKNFWTIAIHWFLNLLNNKAKIKPSVKNVAKIYGNNNQVVQKSSGHTTEIYDDYCVVDGEPIYFGHLIKKGDTPNVKIYGKKIVIDGHIYNWRTKKFEKI